MTWRSAEEIRDYLIAQLNDALHRPGLYGDEIALRVVFDHYAYVAGREDTWKAELEEMRSRGATAPTGVPKTYLSATPSRSRRWEGVGRT